MNREEGVATAASPEASRDGETAPDLARSDPGAAVEMLSWLAADVLIALGGDGGIDLLLEGESIVAAQAVEPQLAGAEERQRAAVFVHLARVPGDAPLEVRPQGAGGERGVDPPPGEVDLRTLLREALAGLDRPTRERLLAAAVRWCAGISSIDPLRLAESLGTLRDGLREPAPRPRPRRQNAQGIDVGALARIDSRSFYVRGWMRDASAEITDLAAISPEGERIPLLGRLHRVRRPDLDHLYRTPRGREEDLGFVGGFECSLPSHLESGWLFEITNAAGTRTEAAAEPVVSDPEEARSVILADLVREPGHDTPLMDHAVPAVTEIQRGLAESARIDHVAEFGRAAPDPVASAVIAIYARHDLLEHQLTHFSADPEMARSDLVFVIDSPELAERTLAEAAELHELYGTPFRIATLSQRGGFGTAINRGAELARSSKLVVMHSDVLPIEPGWLARMAAEYDSRPGVGALGPKLLYDDDSLQHAGVTFRRTGEPGRGVWEKHHRFKGLQRDLPAANEAEPVPAVADACLMIDAELFADVGGLSWDYFPGGYEDTDLCLRLRERDRESWYLPGVELYHLEGRSYTPHAPGDAGARYSSWLHTRRWKAAIEALVEPDGTGVR